MCLKALKLEYHEDIVRFYQFVTPDHIKLIKNCFIPIYCEKVEHMFCESNLHMSLTLIPGRMIMRSSRWSTVIGSPLHLFGTVLEGHRRVQVRKATYMLTETPGYLHESRIPFKKTPRAE